jgi:hypothetical protein
VKILSNYDYDQIGHVINTKYIEGLDFFFFFFVSKNEKRKKEPLVGPSNACVFCIIAGVWSNRNNNNKIDFFCFRQKKKYIACVWVLSFLHNHFCQFFFFKVERNGKKSTLYRITQFIDNKTIVLEPRLN